MDSVKVFENYYNGIKCESSTLSITNSDIFKNGNNEDISPQLALKNSQVKIQNTQVHDGVNNAGIYIDNNSKCEMDSVKVFGNYYNGIFCESSTLSITNSDIFKNGNNEDKYPQLLLENSQVKIQNTQVHDEVNNIGIYIFDNSKCDMDSVKVFGNYYVGILCKSSTLSITNSDIFKNGNSKDNYTQLRLEKSQVNIQNTQVHDGVNNTGISIYDNSKCEMDSVKVFGNYYHGIFCKSSTLSITNSDIFKNGNNKGGYPQLWLEKSQVKIQNTQVHDGVNNTGISINNNSKCKMEHVKTYGNEEIGLYVASTSLVEYNNCSFEDGRLD
jgi:hypothetical protein